MEKINSAQAPNALGPYSQAIKSGQFVFCSGQIGIDQSTGKMQEGLEAQTRQVLKNIEFILKEEGLTLNNVVKNSIFLDDIENFEKVNDIYGEYFTEPYPARSTLAAKNLPKNALIEIEAIAEID